MGAGGQVKLLGTQDDAALANELRTAHVMVVPSSYEGFGIAYLEGMGFGLPAIGGRQGAAGELITQGENGFLVNGEDAAELAAILQQLQQDRVLLARLSLSARQRYLAHPTWEDSGQTIRNFLISLRK
jgi:glycosyltransferase involved in cell wall biosynthesis